MEKEQYETVEDLLNNDQFWEWIQEQKHEAFWEKWQFDNPKRQALIEEAKLFSQQLSFPKQLSSSKEIDAILNNTWTTIEEKSQVQESRVPQNKKGQLLSLIHI